MKPDPLILIAEDDPDDQLLIEMALKNVCPANVEFEFVTDGVELVERLKEKSNGKGPLDVLVLDLNMPRKDGREALMEIKLDPRWSSLPVVILTTTIRPEDVDYCKNFGVSGFYHKPNTFSELEQVLLKICEDFI